MAEANTSQTAQSIPASAPAVTLTMEQLKELIASAAGSNQSGLSASELAKAFAETQKRENAQAPMVSVYNPKGETTTPKPRLRAKTTQNGIELDADTLAWEEIEALNALPAGEWRVEKSNGQRIPFTVKLVRGFDEATIERVEIHYPCKDEHRHDHKSLFDYCLNVLEGAALDAEVERLTTLKREMDRLRRGAA